MLKTPSELQQDLGLAIRARRLLLGWTQEDAALRAGMSLATWGRMEAHGPSSVDSLINAAIALRCDEGLSRLFPAPAATSMDDLLRQQAEAAPEARRRAPRRKRTP